MTSGLLEWPAPPCGLARGIASHPLRVLDARASQPGRCGATNPHVQAAIAGIPEDAWTPIRYPRAIRDDQLRAWVSDAEVAETEYTAVTSKKGQAITARLIVRRVKDLNRKAGEGQDELFTIWRHHAIFTDSPFEMLQAEAQHRDHAVVEQVLADWTDGPLAHLHIGVISSERGLARPGRHQPQPAARRRRPRQPRLRQGPRRHAAPRPDRRRRPRRPPRPPTHHLAPARMLAPPRRVDEPVRSRLRPAARRSRLTSPDIGHRAPERPAAATPPPVPGPARRPAGRRRGAWPGRRARVHLARLRVRRSGRK